MTVSSETRVLIHIRDRLTALVVAAYVGVLLLLALVIMAAVWFFRVEDLRNEMRKSDTAPRERIWRQND